MGSEFSRSSVNVDDGFDSRVFFAGFPKVHSHTAVPAPPTPRSRHVRMHSQQNNNRIHAPQQQNRAHEVGVRNKANPRSSVTTLALTALFPEIVLDVMVAELDEVRYNPPPCDTATPEHSTRRRGQNSTFNRRHQKRTRNPT